MEQYREQDRSNIGSHYGGESGSFSVDDDFEYDDGSQLESGRSGGGAGGATSERTPIYAQKESRWVIWSKVTFLIVIGFMALSSALGVYYTQYDREIESMKTRVR